MRDDKKDYFWGMDFWRRSLLRLISHPCPLMERINGCVAKTIGDTMGGEPHFLFSLGRHSKQAGDERNLPYDVPFFHCPGYLGHPLGKQGSLRRSDVVGRRSERESHDRNAYFGTDNPSSQYKATYALSTRWSCFS